MSVDITNDDKQHTYSNKAPRGHLCRAECLQFLRWHLKMNICSVPGPMLLGLFVILVAL